MLLRFFMTLASDLFYNDSELSITIAICLILWEVPTKMDSQ